MLNKKLRNSSLSPKNKVVVIIGPTSSGKSDLAVAIAKRFKGEVISADSRQVYKGLDIGSGKITKSEMKGIKHHLLDVASPKKVFTVAEYKKAAGKAIKDILSRKKLPIICGGTGLYIDALLYDWEIPEVPPQPDLRESLNEKSKEELFKMLSGLDPNRARTIDRYNKVRLIRALEIVLTTGSPVKEFKPFNKMRSRYDFLKIGIKLPRKKLKEKTVMRLSKRMKQGMVEEVKKLNKRGLSSQRLDELGLEYRYVSRYLRGSITKEEMLQSIERETDKYIKRQMTWFKRDKSTIWMVSSPKAFLKVRNFLKKK